MELDPHLRLSIRQGLARLEDEGHAIPSRVVNREHRRRERLGIRLLILYCRVLEVPRMLAAPLILPDHEIVALQRRDRLQDLQLLGHDVLRAEGQWLLHRD